MSGLWQHRPLIVRARGCVPARVLRDTAPAYRQRSFVERFFHSLERFRAIAIR